MLPGAVQVDPDTSFKGIMEAYAMKRSVPLERIAFLHCGMRVWADQTPRLFDMEEVDEMDAILVGALCLLGVHARRMCMDQ